MTFDGMNVEAVRRIGRGLQQSAGDLDRIRGAVDKLMVAAERNWSGRDVKEFEGWWRDHHRSKLLHMRETLSGLGQAALNNAAEQERVSQGSAGAVVGDPSGGAAASFGSAYDSFTTQVDAVSRTMDYATLGMILKYGEKAVDGLDQGTAWGPFTKGLGYLGVITGGVETVQGVVSNDVGKAGGGLVDVGLATAGIVGGTAAAPVVIPLGVAKTFVDWTIPYSSESQESLYAFQAERLFGCEVSELTPEQASQMTERYEGAMGVVNMLSDKMDQTAQPIDDAAEAFWRWVGHGNG